MAEKVKFRWFKSGETGKIPREIAENMQDEGIGQIISEEEGGYREPELSIPIKTGGGGWLDLTYWPAIRHAKEDFQKSSSLMIRKKTIKNNRSVSQTKPCPHCGKPVDRKFYLKPSQALALAGYLPYLGMMGKMKDQEIQEEREEEEEGD